MFGRQVAIGHPGGMRADSRFLDLSPVFWANVKTISQSLGYTSRRGKNSDGGIKVHTREQIISGYEKLGLSADHLFEADGSATEMGALLLAYFEHRAHVLNTVAEPNLMDQDAARAEYERLLPLAPTAHATTMNKQKGAKAKPAMLTEMVNILFGLNLGEFDSNPMQLTTITKDKLPVRTLSRRVDGAYPAVVNPVAIWEIKEYYYTTTFGSRVADGVYETMLDGMELEELRASAGIDVKHFLIVDSHYTWWVMGRSYLCRIVDLLHQGLVDEVLFGKEVLTRVPEIAKEIQALSQPKAPESEDDLEDPHE